MLNKNYEKKNVWINALYIFLHNIINVLVLNSFLFCYIKV